MFDDLFKTDLGRHPAQGVIVAPERDADAIDCIDQAAGSHRSQPALLYKRLAGETWCVCQEVELSRSRAVLVCQGECESLERASRSPTNFPKTPSGPQSDFAHEALEDSHDVEVLCAVTDISEQVLELGLLSYPGEQLSELGTGFTFVGELLSQRTWTMMRYPATEQVRRQAIAGQCEAPRCRHVHSSPSAAFSVAR
jgi:hypothetical protein